VSAQIDTYEQISSRDLASFIGKLKKQLIAAQRESKTPWIAAIG
jgi:hypothetical protein